MVRSLADRTFRLRFTLILTGSSLGFPYAILTDSSAHGDKAIAYTVLYDLGGNTWVANIFSKLLAGWFDRRAAAEARKRYEAMPETPVGRAAEREDAGVVPK